MSRFVSELDLPDGDNVSTLSLDDDLKLRKRRAWNPDVDSLVSDDIDLLDEEEDGVGCPLPSTPEDNQLLEAEVSN